MKIAAVTMVYNEAVHLPWWIRYYSRQVGDANCYVVDHGSHDGSTAAFTNSNVIRVPRAAKGEFSEVMRAEFISDFCKSLLKFYDWIIYTDVDEMLVVDPSHYSSLLDYCTNKRPDVITAFGVNLLHRLHHELVIDDAAPFLGQRQWMMATASMSKPLLTRIPVKWTAGFHSSDAPLIFDGLINFHLSYVDLDTTLLRQKMRRTTKTDPSSHHSMSDSQIFHMMENWSNMPIVDSISLDENCSHYKEFSDQILNSRSGRENDYYKINLSIWGNELWKVPSRYFGVM